MDTRYEKLCRCRDYVRSVTDFVPLVALVLGSGLGGFADEIDAAAVVPYEDIPGFPTSTVPGHAGRFVFGMLDGVPVVCMQGRVHYYEGYDLSDVVLPARLMGMLGARALFLTNASGGADPSYNAGDFMLIRDHILSFFPNPLVGANIDELGTRFPDMSCVYDEALRRAVKGVAAAQGVTLREGVYVQLTGPSFETPAEVRLMGALGAGAIGMSTACEAVAARHMGLRVVGISCVTNKGAGLSSSPLSHAEVQQTADERAPVFRRLLRESVAAVAKEL